MHLAGPIGRELSCACSRLFTVLGWPCACQEGSGRKSYGGLRGHAQWDTILTALAMEEWKDLVGCSYRGLYSKFSFHLCQGQPTPVEWLSLPSLFILRLLCHICVTFKVMGATCVCSGTVEQSWPELGMGGEKGRRSVTLPHLTPSPCAWKERPTGQAQV